MSQVSYDPAVLSAFSGVGAARAKVDALYFSPGQYWCRIDGTKYQNTTQSGYAAFVETTVIRVVEPVPGKSHRVGECPTRMFMQNKPLYFLPEIKALLQNMFRQPNQNEEMDITPELCVQAFTTPVMVGMVALVDVYERPKKNNTGMFTHSNFKYQIPPAELLTKLSPEEKERWFPNQQLERMAAALTEMAAKRAAAAGK